MLEVQGQEYLDEVKEFAKTIGMEKGLQETLDYLDGYAEHGDRGKTKCVLMKDFAPYSFYFTMYRRGGEGEYERWFDGGCIYHGPHDNGGDGSFPTLSVSLSPSHGWQIHT